MDPGYDDSALTSDPYHEMEDSRCRNARSLNVVGLHWHVSFTEDLSETVQVVW